MKVSFSWLNKYIDISDYKEKIEELSDLLTHAGLEVEEIENQRQAFDHIVVGSILEKKQHPDADKLSVCQVSTGEGVVHQIVCGAKNHKENDKVVVALPGAVLPGDFSIKKAKLRGVESNGMLCSAKELCLSEEGSGIMILPSSASIGQNFADYQALDDIFFELKVTPNRADCLSHYGLARELSTLLHRELKFPEIKTDSWQGSTKENFSLKVEKSDLCPRYAGRLVKNIQIKESPQWLKKSLEGVGINSINNVVDITNFIMLELGQPLHAFDLKYLEGSSIRVDQSKKGESFTSLDGSEYKLDGTELMIYDAKKPVALAGVVGGKNSGIEDSTKDVFIECAYFIPSTVRKTARKMGIETDAAYRFSRGVDPSQVKLALDRCCQLLEELADGDVLGDAHDIYPEPIQAKAFEMDLDFISQKLGYECEQKDWESCLQSLNCEWTVSGKSYTVKPPMYRGDLQIAEDMVEEFARIKGYEHIPELAPNLHGEPTRHVNSYIYSQQLGSWLVDNGLTEALNYAFVNKKAQENFLQEPERLTAIGLKTSGDIVEIKNPLSEEHAVMRTNLTQGLFKNLLHNYRRGLNSGRYFETGFTFAKEGESYLQEQRLGLCFWGNTQNLWKSAKTPLVLELKSLLEATLKRVGITQYEWKTDLAAPMHTHPGQFAYLQVGGENIGYVASMHPSYLAKEKVREEVAIAEFCVDSLMAKSENLVRMKEIVNHPSVERDLAFVCDQDLPASQIQKYLLNFSDEIHQVSVFDLYEGNNLPEGKKSIGFRMLLQDAEKTMTEEQLLGLQNELIKAVGEKFGAATR